MNRTVTLLSQHQLAALVATALDYCVMIVCVSAFGLSPVVGTAVGALFGAVTNFMLGRRWVFDARTGESRAGAALCAGLGGEPVGNAGASG